jgi:hypothetical protein
MRFLLLNIFVYLLINTVHASSANRFSFDRGANGWQNWGQGEYEYNQKIGRRKKGSLQLRVGFGEEHNLYYNFKDLKRGIYQVEFYIKGVDLAKNAVWHFSDIGEGTQSIFEKFSGDTGWVRVNYTLDVKNTNLELWIRLKDAGQIFIDDFSIKKVRNKKKLTFKNMLESKLINPSSYPTKNRCAKEGSFWGKKHKFCPHCGSNFLTNHFHNKLNSKKQLFSKEVSLPFKVNKVGQGVLTPREFYNFNLSNFTSIKWSKYNRIELNVYNPGEEVTEFTLVMGDNKTTNYWSQLNHTASLAPGNNKLSFSLNRNIGERGSTRYYRPLNLKRLSKFFIIVDQDKKAKGTKPFLIKSINLALKEYPKVPSTMKVFDFTSHKAQLLNGITPVTSRSIYNDKRKFGFNNPKFWRVNDSVYSSSIDRYTLGLKSGEFVVDIPNGEYDITIDANGLGYWDTNFWTHRSIEINGDILALDKRENINEYLGSLLRFQDIEPTQNDNPFDIYLKKIFKPLRKTVYITDKKLRINVIGDATGIELNSLIIAPAKPGKQTEKYKTQLEEMRRTEFNWISRKIGKDFILGGQKKIGVVKTSLELSPNYEQQIVSDSISLTAASGERPFVILQIPAKVKDSNYRFSVSPLKSSRKTILAKQINIELLKNQYVSRDMNHETYEILGKYLAPVKSPFKVKKNTYRYLKVGINVNEKMFAGKYQGKLTFTSEKKIQTLVVYLTVLNTTLPEVSFPVGFLGLSPLPKTYFPMKSNLFYQNMRKKSLEMISSRGFTSYSGLPGVERNTSGVEGFNTENLDDLFLHAKNLGLKQPVLTYGGNFIFDILNMDMSKEKKLLYLTKLLSKKNWPEIVHAFSDEAGGYSNKVSSDLNKAKNFKQNYPLLKLGLFGHTSKDLHKFNASFETGLYSSVNKVQIKKLENNGQKWGLYNAASGAIDDPRFAFGEGLYVSRQAGASFYYDWHLSAFQNYPYFDLDGREGDIAMLYPRLNGDLYPALKFEMANQGLSLFRKILLIKNSVKEGVGTKSGVVTGKLWLKEFNLRHRFFSKPNYSRKKNYDFFKFNNEVNQLLEKMFP